MFSAASIAAISLTLISSSAVAAEHAHPEHRAPLGNPLNFSTVTISGISAGAAMAVQIATAHSTVVKAAGIIAGLPYMCALQRLPTLDTAEECMNYPSTIDTLQLLTGASEASTLGEIDNLSNLKDRSFMLFSGLNDTVVHHRSMEILASMLKNDFKVNTLKTFFNYTAEHAWITDQYGDKCDHLGEPYINNCHLDFAGEFLKMAFEQQLGVALSPRAAAISMDNFFLFDQKKFGASPALNSLAGEGFIYVPSNCRVAINGQTIHPNGTRSCHLHVNFHGCEQSRSEQGTNYVSHTGLNEWAESNDIVVVYPQTVKSEDPLVYNPKGCFDWWGYSTGDELNFAIQSAPQIQFVHRIITALTEVGEV